MKQTDSPLKDRVTFGKFQNIDMRVAQIRTAPLAEGTEKPCRLITLDGGHLGTFKSVGQYALCDEADLVGLKVIICANLSPREMGPYTSEVLVLGVPHPDSPEDQSQAMPLTVDQRAALGNQVF